MFTFNKSFFDNIVEICLKAGNAILEEYEKPLPRISLKEDSSPVTEADLRADDIIVTNLVKLDKSIPCISEESSGGNNFFDEKLFWAVDPLDGTKEFIKKTGDFTVNIGLINNKQPIFGIVYAPVLDKIWLGFIDNDNKKNESFRYEQVTKHKHPLTNSKKNLVDIPSAEINILTSRIHPSSKMEDWLERQFRHKKTKIIHRGSSIKICLIAEGNGHIYPRFGRTCIWDTAAGHAILNAAGGFLTNIDTYNELTYTSNIYNPPFLASSYKPNSLAEF